MKAFIHKYLKSGSCGNLAAVKLKEFSWMTKNLLMTYTFLRSLYSQAVCACLVANIDCVGGGRRRNRDWTRLHVIFSDKRQKDP